MNLAFRNLIIIELIINYDGLLLINYCILFTFDRYLNIC